MRLSTPKYITDDTGKKLSVVVPYREYEWMIEALKEKHSIPPRVKATGRISGLRGKLSQMTNEQIDEQLKEIRREWQNDF